MVNSMTLIPATYTPAFGMPVCGHASFQGGISAQVAVAVAPIPAPVVVRERHIALSQGDVTTFAGANGTGKRGYATRWGSSSWSPPSR